MSNIEDAVRNLAEKHFTNEWKIKNGQIVTTYCPFCHGGNNEDKDTFAIGLYNGAYNCLRGSCNKRGSFKELCDYLGERPPASYEMKIKNNSKKNYSKPDSSCYAEINESIISYFATRHISVETLKAFRVQADAEGNILFPFYRDGELVYVKHRKPAKWQKGDGPKEWQDKNTEPILFGMDYVSFNRPLIITEGEIDALSLYEAGCSNVVSVPCGCDNTAWVDICWDWLENFQQIILFGDSDEPGVRMVSSLSKRLGEERCMISNEYPELVIDDKDYNRLCKDANEILVSYGPEYLKAMIDACEPAPVKGILNLAEVEDVDPEQMPRIYTRFADLDTTIGGLYYGGITILSGQRGQGKSTIGGEFMLSAIEDGHNVCAYSGELTASKFKEWIYHQACDAKYVTTKIDSKSGKIYTMIPNAVKQRINEYIDNKFFLFDNSMLGDDDDNEVDSVLKVFTTCAKRYNCKLFLLDNLMTILGSPDEEIRAQGNFIRKLKKFAVKYDVHVICVCHPRKTKPGDVFTNDDVSGSAVITNLADVVLSIEKPNVRITKNRFFGTQKTIICNYNPVNRRIFEECSGDNIIYSWDRNGIEIPENQACTMPQFSIQYGNPVEGVQPF